MSDILPSETSATEILSTFQKRLNSAVGTSQVVLKTDPYDLLIEPPDLVFDSRGHRVHASHLIAIIRTICMRLLSLCQCYKQQA